MGSFNGRPAINGTFINITANYGLTQYRPAIGTVPGNVFNLRGARWTFSNSKWMEPYYIEPPGVPGSCSDPAGPQTINDYPVNIEGGNFTTVQGGVISGIISTTSHWSRAYCNAAGLLMYNPVGPVTVEGTRINRTWDGIRIGDYLGNTSHIIRDCWLSDIRDDGIEIDGMGNVLIQRCLIDRAFVGISSRLTSGVSRRLSNRVTLDGVIIVIHPFPYREDYADSVHMDHGQIFKWNFRSPAISMHNSIVALPNYGSFEDEWLQHWKATVDGCSSPTNAFLWLADTDYPWVTGQTNYNNWGWAKTGANTVSQCQANNGLAGCQPLPDCFSTILKGQAARDYLDSARSAWIAAHPDVGRIQAMTTPTDASGGGQTVLADPAP